MDEEFLPHCTLDHAGLRWYIARVRTSSAAVVASFLFDEFADALAGHLAAVRAGVLPLLRTEPGARAYVDTHWYLERSLADLRSMERHGDPFVRRLAAVCNRVEQQMAYEASTPAVAVAPSHIDAAPRAGAR